jgi:hypothetical protein
MPPNSILRRLRRDRPSAEKRVPTMAAGDDPVRGSALGKVRPLRADPFLQIGKTLHENQDDHRQSRRLSFEDMLKASAELN